MLLARGDVQERPIGVTIGLLAQKYATGQLTVFSQGERYEIVLRGGTIVAASSPHPDDRLSRIALAREWISPDTCAVIEQVCAGSPHADALDVCTVLGELDADTARRLLRRAIAQRASRMLGLETGTYVLSADVRLAVREGTETHVGGVVFQGALLHVSQQRLEDIVCRLGSRFVLPPAHVAELEYLGFGKSEAPLVRALLEGTTFDRLVQLRGIEPPHAYAAVYALVACGLATSTPRMARGTQNPIAHGTSAGERRSAGELRSAADTSRSSDTSRSDDAFARRTLHLPDPSAAASAASAASAAFERGERALRAERLSDAILELESAVSLAPNERRYVTALAWAKFCHAADKREAATDARKVLARVAAYHDAPVEAHYYLGLLERMLERPARAEEHFRAVLDRMPNHVEAATELRFLARRRR